MDHTVKRILLIYLLCFGSMLFAAAASSGSGVTKQIIVDVFDTVDEAQQLRERFSLDAPLRHLQERYGYQSTVMPMGRRSALVLRDFNDTRSALDVFVQVSREFPRAYLSETTDLRAGRGLPEEIDGDVQSQAIVLGSYPTLDYASRVRKLMQEDAALLRLQQEYGYRDTVIEEENVYYLAFQGFQNSDQMKEVFSEAVKAFPDAVIRKFFPKAKQPEASAASSADSQPETSSVADIDEVVATDNEGRDLSLSEQIVVGVYADVGQARKAQAQFAQDDEIRVLKSRYAFEMHIQASPDDTVWLVFRNFDNTVSALDAYHQLSVHYPEAYILIAQPSRMEALPKLFVEREAKKAADDSDAAERPVAEPNVSDFAENNSLVSPLPPDSAVEDIGENNQVGTGTDEAGTGNFSSLINLFAGSVALFLLVALLMFIVRKFGNKRKIRVEDILTEHDETMDPDSFFNEWTKKGNF